MEEYTKRFNKDEENLGEKRLLEGRVGKDDIEGLVIPWGYGDISAASDSANDFYLDFGEIEDYFEELGGLAEADKIDPVAMVYEVAFSEAINDLSRYFDLDEYVYVSGNYIATSWDTNSGGADKELERELNNIDPRDFKKMSKTTQAVIDDIVNQFGIDVS